MRLTPHRWADAQTAAPRRLQVLLHALASFADAEGIAYPSQDKIVRRLGWSKGTIKKWSDVARGLGLMSTRKRFNPRKGHCDAMTYTLHLDRVASPEEVQRQIAKLRFPPPQGKSQKWGFASEGGKSQPTANNFIEDLTTKKTVVTESPARDWIRVASVDAKPALADDLDGKVAP